MASKDKDRENYFRINVLVVDHIKNGLVHMFKYYLQNVRKEEMSFEKFIGEHVEDIKYLKRSRILYQKEVDKLIVGDKAISGLKVDDLEGTLVRRFLDNLCPELFMDEGCNTLQDFLKTNQHDIYHLFKFNEQCCQCAQDYAYPVTAELLNEDQYKKMFKSQPCTKCVAKSGTVCSVSSCTVTEYIKLDYNIKKVVFGHFSPIYKAMQKLKDIRSEVYGHIVEARMPNELYDGYKKDIEENIIVMARICGNEEETQLALDEVQQRFYPELKDILQKNNQILQKIPQQLQELTEEVRTLKTTETNLTKDIVDGVVLHADEDRKAAKEFILNMRGENPDLKINIILYENMQLGTSVFESFANVFDSYRYLFVFVTENFVKAELEMYLSQIVMFDTLTFIEKKARLIPVETDKTYHSALAPLKPLKYRHYLEAKKSQETDQFFNECFRNLIADGRLNYLVN